MESFLKSWDPSPSIPSEKGYHLWLWEIAVEQKDDIEITLWCKNESGGLVTLNVEGWHPWMRVLDADIKHLPGILSIKECTIQKMYGWEPQSPSNMQSKQFKGYELELESLYSHKWISEKIKASNPQAIIGDTLQQPKTRFIHDVGISPCCWFYVPTLQSVHYKNIIPDLQCADIPILRIASFDCEMSSNDGLLPNPHKGDTVFCISTSLGLFTPSYPIKTVSIYLGMVDMESTDDHLIITVSSFLELMETWKNLISSFDPDLVTGWNTEGFDFPFMAQQYESHFVPFDKRGCENFHLEMWKKSGCPRLSLKELASKLKNDERKRLLQELPKELKTSEVLSLLQLNDGSKVFDEDDGEEEHVSSTFLNPQIHLPLRKLIEDMLGTRLEYTPKPWLLDYESDDIFLYSHQKTKKTAFMLGRSEKITGLQTRMMSTAAKGDNVIEKIPMDGRVVFDMMRIIKDDQKPSSNTLRHAADTWLPSTSKLDMPIEELFAIYKNRDSKGAARVVEYCARDAEIPLKLLFKLQYITSWIGLCKVCYLNPDAVINGGQQQRVFSLLSRRVRNTHMINVENSGWPSTPEYTGATVIEPDAGFFTDPVSTLDFASLYPSIIGSNNLCMSTLITNPKNLPYENGKPLFQEFEIEHPLPDGSLLKNTYRFATHVKSVLAEALIHLLAERKSVKKEMENTENEFLADILNKRQMALKVVCNSVYGFTGVEVNKGLLSCKPVAAVTTLIGRKFIQLTKQFVENTYDGARVIYGDTDSVMILWKRATLYEAYELGERAAKEATVYLRNHMASEQGTVEHGRNIKEMCAIVKLEHEKEYYPYLLLKKKNYAGRKWTPKSFDPLVLSDKIDMKGIQAVRRDTVPFIAQLSKTIINTLLHEMSAEKAILKLEETLKMVALNKLPLEQYIISKSISASYANPDSIPHIQAWNRMKARGDSDIPGIGGRMPFLITTKGSKILASRSEHPAFVQSQKLSLDTEYYIKAAFNPIQKLLQFFENKKLEEIFEHAQNISKSKHTVSLADYTHEPTVSSPSPPPKRQKTKAVGLNAFI